MSHMANRSYNHRAELGKLIRYFRSSIEARESDPTYPFPTINAAIADGVTPAAPATVATWRKKHPDLDQQLKDLIALGPYADSGKCQKKPPPGVSKEKALEKLTVENHRDETINKLEQAGLTDKLCAFVKIADPENIEHVKELNRTYGHTTKGWPKDVRGELSLDHKHNHVHRLVNEIVDMSPEDRERFEREAAREINELEEKERSARALRPASKNPVVVEMPDAHRVN